MPQASARTSSVKYTPVGFVSVEHRSFREIKFESAKMRSVVVAAGCQGNLDRIALSGGYHMDLQSIEIFAFTAVIPPVHVVSGRFWINSASVDSNVLADLNRTTVDQKEVFGAGFLVELAEPFEKRFQDWGQPVEPPVELTSAESTAEIPLFGEQVQGRLEVSSEEANSCDRSGHHFGVGDFSLRTFLVASGSEPIAGQAVINDDSGIHRIGSLRERM